MRFKKHILFVLVSLPLPNSLALAEPSAWDEAFPETSNFVVSIGQPYVGAVEGLAATGLGVFAHDDYARGSLRQLLDAEIRRLAGDAVAAQRISPGSAAYQAALARHVERLREGVQINEAERNALSRISRGRYVSYAATITAAWMGIRALIRVPIAMSGRNPGFAPEINAVGIAAKSGGRLLNNSLGRGLSPAARAAE